MELDFVNPVGALGVNPVYGRKEPQIEMSVVIRNAVTPWNFHVTDYCSSQCLHQLETSMTDWYTDYDKGNYRLAQEDLQLGGFYAVKYVSQDKPTKWLRCEIVKPFKKDLPSVNARLVDNGAFYHTSPEHFYPLRKIFSLLPIQGIEATLYASDSTKSPNRHLGAEECRKFYERVEGKHFYAFILNSAESLQRMESLKLILVDTSGERNRYIHEEFNLKLHNTVS